MDNNFGDLGSFPDENSSVWVIDGIRKGILLKQF